MLDLTESGVKLQVQIMVHPDVAGVVQRELRQQIKARFETEGIRFAMPQRVVEVTTLGQHAGVEAA